jgi:ATP-dependent Clp protease adaptor protein ClpS
MNSVLEKRPEVRGQEQQELGQTPGFYEVHLHNDDFTPLEFVIEALGTFFHLDSIKAKTIALEAHTKGRAVCGVYSKEIAETRIDQAIDHARTHEHPLRWSMEAA